MFGAFVNRFGSLLDRRFLLGSWFPALCGALVVGGAYLLDRGRRTTIGAWDRAGTAAQLWLGITAVSGVTLVAFLLHVAPVVRLFEGYSLPSSFSTVGRRLQARRRDRAPEVVSLRRYPRNSDLIRPTRLGNLLTAAEEHAYLRYRIDAVVWWPRFAPVLPQVFRDQLDEALLPLLSLTCLALTLSVGGAAGALLLMLGGHWAAALAYLAATALLATTAYCCALSQAGRYAECIRTAFDLYRHDVLATMRLALPDDLIAERRRWEELTQWIYRGEPPGQPLPYTHPSEAAP